MTKIDKLRKRFLSKPKDFTWDELKSLLISMGFNEFNSGKTSGSRVRFVHNQYNDIILHKPHPNPVLKGYQIKQIISQLKMEGLL
ncbi:MAG: type II toxin-antitoxin system HicA family toxin [Legionella sp.]|uniref:type II toxin-antitoxin system HicA family toxin n=1 Tax=Legionella sp. TaxID=459 RepID=UPI00285006E5|nr:type II toxin-antitoxin system HicA family toxin [Legionella sp.]